MKKSPIFLSALFFYTFSLLLAACTPSPELPGDVEAALVSYWQSLPAAAGVEQHIVQSWPGAGDPEVLTPWAPEMEIWCVIAEISAPGDPEANGERLVWIVLRENDQVGWKAALLATLSSTWPYEACGPGSPES